MRHLASSPLRRGAAELDAAASVCIRTLERLSRGDIAGLSDVLIDCVEGGASVGFLAPMTRAKAQAFWRTIDERAASGERRVLIAEDPRGTVVGTAQLVLHQPENQPHRADLAKMLVHRSARRQGVGGALLTAAEACARREGKTLLVLDTASADAERLYARHGWQPCGRIPGYALYPDSSPCSTTFFYKSLVA